MVGTDNIDPRAVAKFMLQYQQQEDNIIRYQLETKNDLDSFKHELLGEIPISGAWVRDEKKEPVCNEQGANAIVSYMKLHISRHVSLSNYKLDDDINNISMWEVRSFIIWLIKYRKEFEIKNYVDISMITGVFDKLNVATMQKAVRGWEGDGLRKQYTHVESDERVTQVDNKPKFLGALFNKGG